ncbi:MAG: hypothetical protein CM15mP87_09600 [Candidatus Neomarinimicrobiota bacterium]|nr:MAG: hypothetical protein CM15mP87_09600 [Candidatus Neomarinimicrobiota bacterium]
MGLINTEMVDDIEFFSNGFPAEYGNKLSSYGNIRYRNGKKDSLAANISLGMGGAGGLVEGSLTEDVPLSAHIGEVTLILFLTLLMRAEAYLVMVICKEN